MDWFRRPESFPDDATRTRAADGDAGAQFYLGIRYENESDSGDNLEQAAQWFRLAANQNHARAQFHLGRMLSKGQGLPRDEAAAREWFCLAAEAGEPGAQHMLGVMCYRESLRSSRTDNGESRIEAYMWFFLAGAQGCKSSDIAREQVTLRMKREEIVEGNRRTVAFGSKPMDKVFGPAQPTEGEERRRK